MKKHLLNFKMAVIGTGMLFSTALNATNFTAITSGNWSSASTWGGTAPTGILTGDNIIINSGVTVTLDMDLTFSNGFLVTNTFSVNGTLSNSTNNGLTITQGVLAGSGMISIHRLTFSNTGTSAFTGTMNVGTLVNSNALLSFGANATVSDSLILDSGVLSLGNASNLSLAANSTIRVDNGSMNIVGSGIFNTVNNHNVMYVGSSKTSGIELGGQSVLGVWIKMSSNTQSVTMANDLVINGDLHFVTGKMNMNSRKLTLKGDVVMASTNSITSNSTSELLIQGSGNMTSGLMFEAGSSMNTMTIDRGSNGTVKLMSGLNIAGHLHLMNGTYSLENGSTLTMNANSTIHIEGGSMATNTGSFVGTAAYNVEYAGSTNGNSGTELSGSGLHDVTLNYGSAASKVMLMSNATIGGALNMNGGNMDLNGKDLTLNGTMTQATTGGMFIGNNNSSLMLNLTSATTNTLMFDQSNRNLKKLMLNLTGSSTSSMMLGTGLTIANELNLTSGRMAIGTGGDLIIASTGSITGYDNNKYIITSSNTGSGRLQLNVGAGTTSWVTFPVGTDNNYSPAYVQNATSGNFMVRAANEFFANGTTGNDLSSSMSVVKRTWHVEAESGVNVAMNLKLGWMTTSEVNGFNRSNAVLRHYTNNAWDNSSAVTATAGANSTFEVSRTGLTSLSPFGVTDNTTSVGIKQVAAATVGFDVYPNPAKEAISVKAGTSAKFELIDITGRTLAVTSTTEGTTKFDLSKLEKGYYFIKMTDLENNTTGTKRFIKD